MKGSLLKRAKNTYLLRISLGRDQVTGKRSYRTRTFHGTKAQAETVLRDMVLQYETTGIVVLEKASLNSFLAEWLKAKADQVTETTLASYEKHVRLYIQPTLGKLPLSRVVASDVQTLYQRLADQGLQPSIIRTVHTILLQAFKQAILWRRVANNPVSSTSKPRLKKTKATKAMTEEQSRAFLAAATRPDDDVIFDLALMSGMRPGEILALTWRCVDWKNELVRVEASRIKLKGQPATFGPPKTPESFRSITLPPPLMAKLRAHRTRQLQDRLKAGAKWVDLDLVFSNKRGGFRSASSMNMRFYELAEKAGLSGFNLYSLRHTHATLLMQDNEPIKMVAERMGHSSTVITMDTYTHVLPHMQKSAASKFSTMFYGEKDGSQSVGDQDVITASEGEAENGLKPGTCSDPKGR